MDNKYVICKRFDVSDAGTEQFNRQVWALAKACLVDATVVFIGAVHPWWLLGATRYRYEVVVRYTWLENANQFLKALRSAI